MARKEKEWLEGRNPVLEASTGRKLKIMLVPGGQKADGNRRMAGQQGIPVEYWEKKS